MKPFYVKCDPNDEGCGTKYPGDLDNCPKCGASTSLIAIPAALPPNVYVYDEEVYPNIYTLAIINPFTQKRWLFEISDRRNDLDLLLIFIRNLSQTDSTMVGYNNIGYDYPVLHWILTSNTVDYNGIYNKSMSIINSDFDDNSHIIWDNNRIVKQLDLFKIYHFDNKNKRTSLKALEFYMRMKNIRDLPFEPGTVLNNEQKDILIHYNWHDVYATTMFYVRSLEMIEFRAMLGERYGKNFMNHNDAKIGADIFQLKLEEAGIECFHKSNGKRTPKQTIRPSVNLSECIPPYIQFEHPEFQRILNVFKNTTLIGDNVKALFNDFSCTIDGLTYVFGSGGQHASRQGLFQESDTHCIVDLDVEAMYPRVLEKNNFYPEHLGSGFSPIFKEIIEERIRVGKNTLLGKGLKISANGTYGKLGDKYSFVYDLKTMLSVTLTGQLVLSMLVEQVIKIPDTTVLQTNTDGFTIHIPRIYIDHLKNLVNWWEGITQLKMEFNYYSRMWLKNVNSYIAEDANSGKLKLKKDYAYELEPHKDTSALVVPKAIESYLVHGQCIDDFIKNHRDPYDFCLRAKVPRNNRLVMRWQNVGDQELQRITRYFISKTGGQLVKIAPARGTPGEYKRANSLTDQYFNSVMAEIGSGIWDSRIHTKNKSKYDNNVETNINSGWKSTDCSDMDKFDWSKVNYDWYIAEAEKLII